MKPDYINEVFSYCRNMTINEEGIELKLKFDKYVEQLDKLLNQEQRQIFDNLIETVLKYEDYATQAAFKEGFKIGMRLKLVRGISCKYRGGLL